MSETKVINPFSLQVVGKIPNLTRDQVRTSIENSRSALKSIQALTIAERSSRLLKVASLIRSNAGELASLMTREIGRPIKSSRGEIIRSAQIFELVASEVRGIFTGEFVPLESYDYPAGNKRRIAFVIRQPLGVVGTITPFNFPASSFAHKVAPALAVGNTVVHKPTVLAPLTQSKIAEYILASGFPEGSVSVVTGNSAEIGDEFIENPAIALISFTGSEKVGLDLASRAVARGKHVIMELGGSDAQIVLEDADLKRATEAAVFGRFDYAGQFCNSTKRLIVRSEIATEFKEMLTNKLQNFKIGDPMDEETSIGPLISADAIKKMQEFVDEAKSSGGELIFQGKVPEGLSGFFFPPTIIRANEKMKIAKDEVFGPILPVIEASSDEDAISIANSTEYGLDASIFTSNFTRAYDMAAKLKVGTVMINDTTRLRWDNLPFGGAKKSGIGREGAKYTMLEMTESKLVEYTLDS